MFCRERVWGHGAPLSTGHLAAQFLADGWNVLWISRPLNPASPLAGRGWALTRDRLSNWLRGPRRVSGGPWTYTAFTLLPYRRRPRILDSLWVAESSLRLTVPRLASVLRRSGFASPDLLWLSDLSQVSILRLVRPRTSVLHVTDDYRLFPRAPSSTGELLRRVAANVDASVTTHPDLASLFDGLDVPVHFIPHGVDTQLLLAPTPEPVEYEEIPAPRIVFLGALADWMDWPLIAAAARALPDTSFVFIGQRTTRDPETAHAERETARLPNVWRLGPKRGGAAAGLLRHADVGIIPFRRLALKRYSNPMKLYEYLAAGLPVVSTLPYWEWNALWEEPGVPRMVHCGATKEEFVAGLTRAIELVTEAAPDLRAWGARFASRHGWGARYRAVLERLDLPRRGSP